MKPIFEVAMLTEEEISSLKISKVWKSDCPVPIERLRIVKLSYWDFEGQQKTNGQIMVLDAVAKPVMRIFQALYNKKFPLAKVRLMDYYEGDDSKSMEDNNTSSFNCRNIVGGFRLSLHSYGLAIDINPVENPFIQFPDNEKQSALAVYNPAKGRQYANRLQDRPGKSFRPGMAEQVVSIFKKNGFTVWGGDWDTPIDYQHFQLPRDVAEHLIELEPEEAISYFEKLSSE